MQIDKWMLMPRGSRRLPVAYPTHPLFGLESSLGRLFNEVLSGLDAPLPAVSSGLLPSLPHMSLEETDDVVLVELELPGLSEDDIEITLDEDRLTIARAAPAETAEAKVGQEDEARAAADTATPEPTARPRGMARHAGSFQRIVPLQWEIDREHVEATLDKGVLSVRLPKLQPAVEPSRRITVRSV